MVVIREARNLEGSPEVEYAGNTKLAEGGFSASVSDVLLLLL